MEFLLKRRDGRAIAQKKTGTVPFKPGRMVSLLIIQHLKLHSKMYGQVMFSVYFINCLEHEQKHTLYRSSEMTRKIFSHFDMLSIQTPLLSRKHTSVFDLIS
jgi:hypothetical protein